MPGCAPGSCVRTGSASPGLCALCSFGLVRLIGQAFRAAYFASTVKHNEMLRDGRGDEINATIEQGRLAQAELMQGG